MKDLKLHRNGLTGKRFFAQIARRVYEYTSVLYGENALASTRTACVCVCAVGAHLVSRFVAPDPVGQAKPRSRRSCIRSCPRATCSRDRAPTDAGARPSGECLRRHEDHSAHEADCDEVHSGGGGKDRATRGRLSRTAALGRGWGRGVGVILLSARIEFTDVVDARGWWQFEVHRVTVVAGSEAQPTTRTQAEQRSMAVMCARGRMLRIVRDAAISVVQHHQLNVQHGETEKQ